MRGLRQPIGIRRGPPVAFFLLVCLSTVAANAAPGDADAIRKVFLAYRGSILAGDGPSAAALLSRSTYDYYDAVRRLALTGDARTVQNRPLSDQVQILLYRLRVPREKLDSLSPLGLIAYSIDQGWIGKESVEKIQPGPVVVRGDTALVHVVVDGEDRGPGFRFDREDDGWRLDLVPVMRATDRSLRMAVERENMGESDFILAVVERALDREVGIEAWIPLQRESEEADGRN